MIPHSETEVQAQEATGDAPMIGLPPAHKAGDPGGPCVSCGLAEEECPECKGEGWVSGIVTVSGHAPECWGGPNCAHTCPVQIQEQVQADCPMCGNSGRVPLVLNQLGRCAVCQHKLDPGSLDQGS